SSPRGGWPSAMVSRPAAAPPCRRGGESGIARGRPIAMWFGRPHFPGSGRRGKMPRFGPSNQAKDRLMRNTLGLLSILAVGLLAAPAHAADPIVGSWSGSGTAKPADGQAERVQCRLSYAE